MAVNLLFFVLMTSTRYGKRKQHATSFRDISDCRRVICE